MQEQKDKNDDAPFEPRDDTTTNPGSPVKVPSETGRHPLTRGLVIVFFCFVASFLGAWVFVSSGLIKVDSSASIAENKEKIVLQEGEVVADVAKKVSPSVVSIVVTGEDNTDPFLSRATSSAGTGIVVSKDGYILTNGHVIPEGATGIQVLMSDETVHTNVELVGRDPFNDIAFLKIADVNDLTPARLGDSAVAQVGQKVVAIGNALGQYQTSVTSGIISAVGRPLTASTGVGSETESLENLLQTDAAINPGNSGGPLVNLKGEVIGINTAVAESAEGIGFAIPINDARGLIKSVTKNGRVDRAYLGVRYVTITPAIVSQEKLAIKQGAYLTASGGSAIIEGSPASKAGLKDGDIITKVNDSTVDRRNPLSSLLSLYTVGETVELTVLRDGKEVLIKVSLEAYRS